MREIKFRAWDIQYERMIEAPYHFDMYHFSDENRVNQKQWQYYGDWRDLEDGRGSLCHIMQFTGLLDKNKKEIYEGDILQGSIGKNMQVVWRGDLSSFALKEESWMYDHFFGEAVDPGHTEVIGNIYEHPSLLTSPQ